MTGKFAETGFIGISIIPWQNHWHEKAQRWCISSTENYQWRLSGQHRLAAWFTGGCKHINTYSPFLFFLVFFFGPHFLLCIIAKQNCFIFFQWLHPTCSVFVHGKSCPNTMTLRRQVTDISWAKASAHQSSQNVRWWLTTKIYIIATE